MEPSKTSSALIPTLHHHHLQPFRANSSIISSRNIIESSCNGGGSNSRHCRGRSSALMPTHYYHLNSHDRIQVSSSNASPHTLLVPALAVVNTAASTYYVRLFIDLGSELTFIYENISQSYKRQRKHSSLDIIDIGGSTSIQPQPSIKQVIIIIMIIFPHMLPFTSSFYPKLLNPAVI